MFAYQPLLRSFSTRTPPLLSNRTKGSSRLWKQYLPTSFVDTRYVITPLTTSTPTTAHAIPKRGYHERVIDHYYNPRNVGSMDKAASHVGTGIVGAPACGDVMKFQIEVKEGKVASAVFKTFGCGSAIASSSLATEWVTGKTIDECLEIKNSQIAKYLSLPPVKLHCSMLAEDAIKAAVYDYKQKQLKQHQQTQHENNNENQTTQEQRATT